VRTPPKPGFRAVPARNSQAHERHRSAPSKQRETPAHDRNDSRPATPIKALLDGDRPGALPPPGPCHPTHGNNRSAPFSYQSENSPAASPPMPTPRTRRGTGLVEMTLDRSNWVRLGPFPSGCVGSS
jgi:hypothetical protein